MCKKFARDCASPQETSSAQYILQQYLAASGGHKLLASVRNTYTMGKVRMVATEIEKASRLTKNRNAARGGEHGRFVLWQMAPEMWYIELAVGGSKVHAGCNGKLVWRHTPWLGAHAAKGPVRQLRRGLQVCSCLWLLLLIQPYKLVQVCSSVLNDVLARAWIH